MLHLFPSIAALDALLKLPRPAHLPPGPPILPPRGVLVRPLSEEVRSLFALQSGGRSLNDSTTPRPPQAYQSALDQVLSIKTLLLYLRSLDWTIAGAFFATLEEPALPDLVKLCLTPLRSLLADEIFTLHGKLKTAYASHISWPKYCVHFQAVCAHHSPPASGSLPHMRAQHTLT